MGIPSLLNLLKSIVTKRHIKDYKNQTIAVDVYTWLHPAIYTCSYELANNIETTKHIDFCVKKVDQILAYGIKKVVLIFDGRELPSKKGTEDKRERSREESKNEALKLLAEGKKEQAYKKFASSIDVTPQMAYEFICAVRDRPNVECIVSPYEADAQLAYLSKIGYIDVVFSEDSDLLAFGCKKVLFKLYKGDQKDQGDEICLDNIKNCKEINMSLWEQNMFLTACIFAGCDYLPSLKKMGINTAFKLVGEHKTYKKCLHSIQQKNYEIPADYDEKFQLAFLTFRFQYVYCPLKDKIVHLNSYDLEALKIQYVDKDFHNHNSSINWRDYEENVIITPLIFKILNKDFDWSFLGDMDENIALKVSKCMIDPITLQPYKEIKQRGFGFEGSSSMPVKMGSGGLSSLQSKNIFEKKGRQQASKSDSVLSGKQSSISNFIKVGGSKQNIQKASSNDDKLLTQKQTFFLEEANSNSFPFNKSKSNDKSQEMGDNINLNQQAMDLFAKSILNKNLVKPFKAPSASNSQYNTQQTSSQVSKKKGELKRPYNENYFNESSEEIDYKEDRIVESQLEDALSSRKDASNNGMYKFEENNQYKYDRMQEGQLNQSSIEEELQQQQGNRDNHNEEEDDQQYANKMSNQISFKSNNLIAKNLQMNSEQQKLQGLKSLSGIQQQNNQNLSNKFSKKLVIDRTPIKEVKIKYPQSLLEQNMGIQRVSKQHNFQQEAEENDNDNESYNSNIEVENNQLNQEEQEQKEEKGGGEYIESKALIKRVLQQQQQQQQQQQEQQNSQEDNKSCFSTQSQRDRLADKGIAITINDTTAMSQKFTQKTNSNESTSVKQNGVSSLASSTVASTNASKDKNSSRLDNFSKLVDGNLVIDSQYLIHQHPEYNFLEKFSIFFSNEINI